MMAKKILFANIAANLLYCNSVFGCASKAALKQRHSAQTEKQSRKRNKYNMGG
jgi:hypothetical protein